MIAEQISVFMENKKGHLAELTKILAEYKVDIRAISVFDTPEFGILRMIVNKPEDTIKILKDNGYTVRKSEVFAIDVKDCPGSLYDVVKLFDQHDINIEYVYSFVLRKTGDPLILFKVDNTKKALDVLKQSNVAVIPKDKIYE